MTRSRFTRREILVGAGAAAVVAAGLPGGNRRRATAQESPVRGGTLKVGQNGTPPGYDPQKWWSAQAGVGATSVSERLIELDASTGERIPLLVEGEPTVERDGTRYTFKLRPGVKFHKGYGTVTAADVKYSWERLMSPALGAEAGTLYFSIPFVGIDEFRSEQSGEVAGLKAVDELTFQVELQRPDSAFLPAFTYSHAVVIPKRAVDEMGEQFNWNPIGTGPFMVDAVDPAKNARLVRHPDYWNPSQPYVDAVDVEFNVDPELSLLRIQRGEQDLMVERIPVGSLNEIRDNAALKNQLFEGPENDCQWLSLPTQLAPFDDLRVRQAIAMAVNKEKLARVVKGLGTPATGGLFSPLSKYYTEGLAYPYDPERAKALLAEAGVAEGTELPFWGQNQAPYADMGPSIQQDLADVGLKANWTPMIYDQFIAETNPGPPAMLVFAWEDAYGHGSYVADAAFTSSAISQGCCNYAKWSSPEVDAMTKQAHESDEATSIEIYKQIDKIAIQDQVLWVPLLYPQRASLISARLRGFQFVNYPAGTQYERYWFAQ